MNFRKTLEDDKQAVPVSDRLRHVFVKIRKIRNISQVKVAARLSIIDGVNVTQGYVSKVEAGRTNASPDRWKKFCDAIGIPVELLYFEAIFEGKNFPAQEAELIQRVRSLIGECFVSSALSVRTEQATFKAVEGDASNDRSRNSCRATK